MPGNGQGIVVSIQAKIEGWQNQVKAIQNALKNIKPGAGISKELIKDLKQVQSLIDNLGKNMNQRLTSESQITSFTDKIIEVERIFDRLGTSMSHISFGDIDPSYITANFKDLLDAIEKANNALDIGMQTSFQNALSEAANLQNLFKELKIDPKNLNIEQLQELLNTRSNVLSTELKAAWNEADKLHSKMKELNAERKEYNQKAQAISDPAAVANSILGVLPANGTILDTKDLDAKIADIRAKLMQIGIKDSDLNKIIPQADELLKQGKWDKLPDLLEKYISKAKREFENKSKFAERDYGTTKTQWQNAQRAAMLKANEVGRTDAAKNDFETIIKARVEAETQALRDEVIRLRAMVENKATVETRSLGGSLKASSAQGLSNATAEAKAYEAQLGRVKSAEQALGKLQSVVQRWFSIYAVIRMIGNAIRSMTSTIKELDKTITNIAIVTDMNQDDLWKQMPKYTQMAREYASSISGVYEVSQLYYQQGLQMNEVMSLTEATLKMARISGLDYSDATNYMTNAVRSFKMEMSDATTVVDVYSAIAASSATSVTELATAMSKTASSAQAVGASFENTTAMMAVMIEATRESPENIGSALKSIISRYGELKENKTGIDEEGEEYSLNKVDKALQSVGISIHDAKGEFRDFDDVIQELADSWDTIDKNTQRYIATVMAGNRQQSRFLALVSSGDRLRELSDEAANSEDASQLQFLKSLDSVDAKVQQLQTSIQALYTNSGLEQAYKNVLDFANNVVKSLDNIADNQGLVGVIGKIGGTFAALATLVTTLFTTIKLKFSAMQAEMTANAKVEEAKRSQETIASSLKHQGVLDKDLVNYEEYQAAMTKVAEAEEEKRIAKSMKASNLKKNFGMLATGAGLALTTISAGLDINTSRTEKAITTGLGGILSGVGTQLMMGGWIGAIMGALTAIPSVIEAIGMSSESVNEKLTKLKTNVENAENKEIISKDELKTLTEYEEKLKELSVKQYQSVENKQAYLDLSNEIATKYPELISYIDEEGNKIVELGEAYANLKQQKEDAYTDSARQASVERVKAASDAHYRLDQLGIKAPSKTLNAGDTTGAILNGILAWSTPDMKIFDQSNAVFNNIAEGLANYGFGSSSITAASKNLTQGSLADIYYTAYGVHKVLNNQNLVPYFNRELQGFNLSQEGLDYILNPSNHLGVNGGIDSLVWIGNAVDQLMEENLSKEQINKVLAGIIGKDSQGNIAHINDDLYNYRMQVLSSEKATSGYDKLIKTENKNLYSTIIAQDKYKISEGLQNQFLQYDFQKQWENYSKDLTNEQIGPAWEAFSLTAEENIDNAIKSYSDMINSITDSSTIQLIDKMVKDPSTYSRQDWANLYQQVKLTNNTDLMEFIGRFYADTIAYAGDNFINGYENIAKKYDVKINSKYYDIAGKISGKFLSSILDQYESIFKNENISNKNKQTLVNAIDNAYLTTNKITDQEKKEQALSILSQMDFTTQSGLYEAIEAINKLKLGNAGKQIIDELTTLSEHISVNLVTEFSTFTESIISNLSDFEKAISSATKGMDLKSAIEMATKMGKSINDFVYKDGKYYYENLTDIQSSYLPQNNELLIKLEDIKNKAIASSKNLQLSEKFDITQLTNREYVEQFADALAKIGLTVDEVMSKNINKIEDIELFNIEYINGSLGYIDESYIENWSSEIEKLGFSIQDVINYALGNYEESLMTAEDFNNLHNLSRTIITIDSQEEINSIIEKITGVGLSIDEVIKQQNNNLDNVLEFIDSSDFEGVEGIDNSALKAYITGYMSRSEEDLGLSFSAWLEKYLNKLYNENVEAINEYTKDQSARIYLSNGNIKSFLSTIGALKTAKDFEGEARSKYGIGNEADAEMQRLSDEANQTLIAAIASGDTSNLPDKLQKYAKLIYDTFASVQSTVTNAMFNAATGGQTSIWADEKNVNVLQQFVKKGWIKKEYDQNNGHELSVIAGQQYEFDIEALKQDEENFKQWVQDNQKLTNNERKEYLKKYFEIKYPKVKSRESTLAMAEKTKFTYNDISSYMEDLRIDSTQVDVESWAKAQGLDINALGEFFISSQKVWDEFLDEQLGADDGSKEYRQNKAKLESIRRVSKSETQISTAEAIQNLLKDTQEISETSREKLAEAIGDTEAAKYFKDNFDGTYTLDVTKLRKDVEDGTLKIYGEAKESLLEGFATLGDEAISAITNVTQLITSGTNKQANMQKIVNTFNGKYSQGQLFKYDEILNAYTFNPAYLQEYQQIQAKDYAKAMGMSEKQALAEVSKQTQEALASQINIEEFLKAENREDGSQAREKLIKQIENYRKAYLPESASLWPEEDVKEYLETGAKALAKVDVEVLEKGGKDAVDKAQELADLAGKELTQDQIDSYYYSQTARIKEFADKVADLTTGSYVADGEFRNILTEVGMIDSDGLVQNIGNVAKAYKKIYDKMGEAGEATAASLNEIYAKYLTETERGDIDAIEAMSDAMGMTYDTLGQILGKSGIKLEDWINDTANQSMFEHIGGGKIRITDFTAFAAQRGWTPGSEEYTSAFKTYNDSLIEYDRQTEKSIVEELKNVAAAKPGDKINITNLVSKLEKGLDTVLEIEGATIYNGILTITEGADLTDITNQLLAMVPESVKLIPDEIAEIADAVNAILQQIASLIKDGINGTLSNANKQSLTSWGNANGLNLQFTQTAEGFKLAQSSAIEVYNTLKSIDALQGKLVFDELNKSLQESNEHYKSISDVANRIREIESIAPDARSKEYAQELALAKEIYAVRSTTDDYSFSFMSNKIPGAQNNPINYFNNWATAIRTFNDALKNQKTYFEGGESFQSGVVDYDFWYNLVTEMNNIAALGGNIEFAGHTLDGSLEAAAALIQKGADSLVVTDTGEIKVALSKISVDFESGADAFSGNVTEGIQALAKSQSKMLDGLIKLLEAVVAMEKLGDIDVGDNNILDLGELFVKTDIGNWKIADENLVNFNAFLEQAGDSLDSIIINGQKFTDLAEKAKVEGLDQAMAENFTAIMNSLYQMYRSGDYNLDNLYDSIQQIMAQSKFTGKLQLGDTILHVKNGAIIIETEDKKGKKKFQTPNGETYDTMGEAIARSAIVAQGVKDGITYEEEIATGNIEIKTLGANITITSDKEGNLTFKNGDGEPISAANINEYIQTLIDAQGLEPTEAAKLKTNVGLEIGTIKLDSFSYKSIDSKIREEFEKKLASGSQIEVDAFIDANPVLKQFKGKTGAEITEMLHLDDVKVIVDNSQATEAINAVTEALDAIDGRVAKTTIITYKKTVEEGTSTSTTSSGNSSAKKPNFKTNYVVDARGNVGTANAKGTLMGELGPELVVSNGRYFVAGQNGPEMVNLANDAIVFNHLQTKSLLEKGTSTGRGQAITNERNAVSYAKGNVNGGPAHASASAALSALRQLKAQWDALAGLSAKDLAGKGGGGGGGGGDPKAFLKDLERWYDWLQHIAQLEKEINYEESLRNKISSQWVANGHEYYNSQKRTLEALQDQLAVQNSLTESQEAYFEKRRKELNEQSAFSALYGFSSTGQLYYKDVYADGKSAFEWLSDLVGRNETTGEANYTAEEQYKRLVAAGFEFAMKYDSSGNEIKHEGKDWYNTALQAFWDKIDADKEEMQSLHDSVEDGYKQLEDLQKEQNEILKEMRDNQMEVEQKVYDAIVEIRQRVIDELKDTKDAIQDSNDKFIQGLDDVLKKEQDMYNNDESRKDLDQLRRKRDVLVRSGGSAAEIASLNNEIANKERETYFDKQQEQIDAIQEASDKQIEKLEQQIQLETELLDYQKKYGLLWAEVTQIMSESPEEIARFIAENTEEYWNKSPVASADAMNQLRFSSEKWVSYRDDGGLEQDITLIRKKVYGETDEEKAAKKTESGSSGSSSSGGAGSGDGKTGGAKHGYSFTYNGAKASKSGYASKDKAYSAAVSAIEAKAKAERDAAGKNYPNGGTQYEYYYNLANQHASLAKSTINAYSTGGINYETGLAMLHGTPQKPEAVLNAEQTKVLRDNILGNRSNSLVNLLKSYNEAYKGLSSSTYDSISNNNLTQIDKAEINLHIDKLANDYDSRQAANTIMDEMLRIASKTKANNSVRR